MSNLRGFWKPAERSKQSTCVSRPDLMSQHNAGQLLITPYAASPELEAHIIEQAPSHYATSEAPSTWEALRNWADYTKYNSDLDKLPVFDKGCDRTIYSRPQVNHAFRAWHDSLHLSLNAGFDRAGESAVAAAHVDSIRDAALMIVG